MIDGRSCHEIFSQQYDENLEDLLLTAERIALENRLDLMNARAQLPLIRRTVCTSTNWNSAK